MLEGYFFTPNLLDSLTGSMEYFKSCLARRLDYKFLEGRDHALPPICLHRAQDSLTYEVLRSRKKNILCEFQKSAEEGLTSNEYNACIKGQQNSTESLVIKGWVLEQFGGYASLKRMHRMGSEGSPKAHVRFTFNHDFVPEK